MSDLTPSQERAVRLALKCASLTKQLDQCRQKAEDLEIALRRAQIQLERVGVSLDLEAANREERSA